MTDFATLRKRQFEEAAAAAGGASSSGASSSTGLHNSNYGAAPWIPRASNGDGVADPAAGVPTPAQPSCRRARTFAGRKVTDCGAGTWWCQVIAVVKIINTFSKSARPPPSCEAAGSAGR